MRGQNILSMQTSLDGCIFRRLKRTKYLHDYSEQTISIDVGCFGSIVDRDNNNKWLSQKSYGVKTLEINFILVPLL